MFSKCLAAINYLTSTHRQHTAYGAEQTKEAELEKVKTGGQTKGCTAQDSYRLMPVDVHICAERVPNTETTS